jgi:hypothetical protein
LPISGRYKGSPEGIEFEPRACRLRGQTGTYFPSEVPVM